MKGKGFYSKLAINAMYRASDIAEKIASENNLKMPLWKDGKIVYINPKNPNKNMHVDSKKLG